MNHWIVINLFGAPRIMKHWFPFIACALAAAMAASAAEEVFRVRPVDHGKALVNPGMGWTMHFYSNVTRNYGSRLLPCDTLDDFPGVSTVYLRLPWAILDTPAQRWTRTCAGCARSWAKLPNTSIRCAASASAFSKWSEGAARIIPDAPAHSRGYAFPEHAMAESVRLKARSPRNICQNRHPW